MSDSEIRLHLQEASACMKDEAETANSRELALAITKVDEALLWFEEDRRLKTPPINEKAV